MSGGRREGAGRKPAPEHLKKVPYNTKLPRWLREWLTAPEREESGPVMIERALCRLYKLKPPAGHRATMPHRHGTFAGANVILKPREE